MIVYKIVNKINKKVYIGQTVQPLFLTRSRMHKLSFPPLNATK
jgi:hypothetical protein